MVLPQRRYRAYKLLKQITELKRPKLNLPDEVCGSLTQKEVLAHALFLGCAGLGLTLVFGRKSAFNN